MKHSSALPVIIPAGKYYLGDPCYSVPDSEWMDLGATCDWFENPVGTLRDGTKIYAMSTAWGDGEFRGSDGFYYGVDAGIIGLVPVTVKLDDDFMPELVKVVEFDHPVMMFEDKGVLHFGHISIDTDPRPDYDDYTGEENED